MSETVRGQMVSPAATRLRRRRAITADRLIAVLLIAPSAAAIAVFVYGFIGFTVFASFTKWDNLSPDFTWVGWKNYAALFNTVRFRIDLGNTVTFTLLFLAICLSVGFILAVLLDRGIRGEAFFRSIYLLLDRIGLGMLKTGWYTDPRIGIKAVVIAAVWQMSGYVMAMYLAGLRGIPEELREAARVDGANDLQVYRSIIVPLLHPITLGAIIILGHISLKIFDLVVAMTGPGPGFSSDVPAFFMFDTTFRGNNFAQGAGIAVILLLMVAVLIVPYLVYSLRTETQR